MTFWAALIQQLWASLLFGVIQLLSAYAYYGNKGYPTRDTKYIQIVIFILWTSIGVYYRCYYNVPFMSIL